VVARGACATEAVSSAAFTTIPTFGPLNPPTRSLDAPVARATIESVPSPATKALEAVQMGDGPGTAAPKVRRRAIREKFNGLAPVFEMVSDRSSRFPPSITVASRDVGRTDMTGGSTPAPLKATVA